jgi:hypothetical protein
MANSFGHQMGAPCCPFKRSKKPPGGVPVPENAGAGPCGRCPANNGLPVLPGFVLSTQLRPPMLIQLRDFNADELDVRFDRFQLIDSDFV